MQGVRIRYEYLPFIYIPSERCLDAPSVRTGTIKVKLSVPKWF